MSLTDYSHVIATGFDCMPVRQLQLATKRLGINAERLKGPFDWLVAPLSAVVRACESDFDGFFDPREVRIVGTLGRHWRVWSPQGFLSIHHFDREEGATEISPAAWLSFREWVEQRRFAYEAALADPYANVLVLRVEDPLYSDDPGELSRLLDAIARRARGQVSLIAVGFGRTPVTRHPRVRSYCVEPSWPNYLPVRLVDWNFDYGLGGEAWEGHEPSWQRLWTQV